MLNYGTYLVEDAGETVTVFMPDGRRDVYVPDGQGAYTKPFGTFNTLTKLSDTSYELLFLDGTVYIYDIPAGTSSLQPLLVEIRDAYNQSLTFVYNNDVQLEKIVDALGRETILIDNENDGLIDRINDPFGRFALFEYDSNRNLIKITDMGNYWTEFSYDTDVYLTKKEDPRGSWDFYIEPADGIDNNDIRYAAPGGRMWENYRITITNPLGEREEYYYYGYTGAYSWYVSPKDYIPYAHSNYNNHSVANKTKYTITGLYEKGKISKIIYPGGGYVKYLYDESTGRTRSISDYHDTDSGVTQKYTREYAYNSNGLVSSFTDARDNITSYIYYPNSIDVEQIRYNLDSTPGDDNILLKTFTYNGNTHDVASITDELGNVTQIDRNSLGQLTTVTDAKNTSIELSTGYIYDPVNYELKEIKRNGNNVITLTRDPVVPGRIQSSTDATGLTLTYEYDLLNQIKKIIYPDSKYEETIYSSCCPGIIDSKTDRTGLTTYYTHDDLKRLTEIEYPKGKTNLEYDANGNVIKLIDSNKKATVFEYDTDNRLTRKVFPDGKSMNYTYDSMGLLTKVTSPRNAKEYGYDENHNLVSMTYSDGTPNVIIVYDDYDRVKTRTDGTGVYHYEYYADSKLMSVDGPWVDDTITYQYDALGQIKNIIPQGGQTVTYRYDYDIENLDVPSIGRLKDILTGSNTFTYGYDGANPLIQNLTRPNGSITEYLYNDPLKRLTDVLNKDLSTQIIDSYNYEYNNLDVRSRETITNGEAIGSFIEGLTTYDYNQLNQLLNSSNPEQQFLYDDDGNMTQGYTPDGYVLAMTYDGENRLKSAEYADGGGIPHRTEFFYDGNNLLVEVKKYDNGNMVSDTRFVRAGFLAIQERDENNAVTREYTWGLNDGGGIGGLLNVKQGAQEYNYLYDGKGNVTTLIDTSQSPVASYRYDTFGVLRSKNGTLEQPFMFSTKRYFEDIGVSYFGYRYYVASLGRWITRDPLGEAGGINLYTYVQNNPVNFVDPLGLWVAGGNFGGSFTFRGMKFSLSTAVLIDSQGNIGIVTQQEAGAGIGKSVSLFNNAVFGWDSDPCGEATISDYAGTGTSLSGSYGPVTGSVAMPDANSSVKFFEVGAQPLGIGTPEVGVTRTFGQEYSFNIFNIFK